MGTGRGSVSIHRYMRPTSGPHTQSLPSSSRLASHVHTIPNTSLLVFSFRLFTVKLEPHVVAPYTVDSTPSHNLVLPLLPGRSELCPRDPPSSGDYAVMPTLSPFQRRNQLPGSCCCQGDIESCSLAWV